MGEIWAIFDKVFANIPLLNNLKSTKMGLILGALLIILITVSVWIIGNFFAGFHKVTFHTLPIEEGSIVATVNASGTLNPVKSIVVGTQVSGMIKEINVDFNSPVKKGQVIAKIDPREYQARYDQAFANYELAQRNLDFNLKLIKKGFISKAALVQTEGAFKAAFGALNLAKKSLSDTVIHSPVDGVVVKRTVEVGQTVAATLQAPELFVIAQNLAEMQVEVSVDEADVGRLSEGLDASFTVDAFPGRVFQSKVMQIRKSPISIQNVVTYTVLISADNYELKLLPGMTANVRIIVERREKALKVPNVALRFRMPNMDTTLGVKEPASTSLEDRQPSMPAQVGVTRMSDLRRLWVVSRNRVDRNPQEIQIRTGLTDGSFTEVLPGIDSKFPLQKGDLVVVGIQNPSTSKSQSGPRLF
jgi:HlyD family secretion protein